MSEEKKNAAVQEEEQYSLNDDRRVKVLSPGALVAKRFFRNRLAVLGLIMLASMAVFSFIGGMVMPYGQDQQFYTYTSMDKEYVGVTATTTCGTTWPTIRSSAPSSRPSSCWPSARRTTASPTGA